jgi:hypothetical protein
MSAETLTRAGLEFAVTPQEEASLAAGYAPDSMVEAAAQSGLWTVIDGQTVWVACGDDRKPTAASVDELQRVARSAVDSASEPLRADQVTVSCFGSTAGLAESMMAVGIMHYGKNFYYEVGGMKRFSIDLGRMILQSAQHDASLGLTVVLPSLHTAANSEALARKASPQHHGDTPTYLGTSQFWPYGSAPVGCARNMNSGEVSWHIGYDTASQEAGQADVSHVWRSDTDTSRLSDGHAELAALTGRKYAFGRQQYDEAEQPVMSLAGVPHIPAEDTGVMASFDPHLGSRPGGLYRIDGAAITVAGLRAIANSGYTLPAGDIIQSLVLTAVPTRAVLASQDVGPDKTPDPRRLPLGVYFGRFNEIGESLDAIERLVHA